MSTALSVAASGSYQLVCNLEQTLDAWRLVHDVYCDKGLIAPNPTGVHTFSRAIGDRTMVVVAQERGAVTATISAYLDSSRGLPLDQIFRDELDALRASGRRLAEVGLYAHRESGNRHADALFDLMRFAFFFALHGDCDDIVIGVHPRHAAFYRRLIGFTPFGEERAYPAVCNRPAVLLRLDLRESLLRFSLHRGLRHFLQHRVEASYYRSRYRFTDRATWQSPLRHFLESAGGAMAN